MVALDFRVIRIEGGLEAEFLLVPFLDEVDAERPDELGRVAVAFGKIARHLGGVHGLDRAEIAVGAIVVTRHQKQHDQTTQPNFQVARPGTDFKFVDQVLQKWHKAIWQGLLLCSCFHQKTRLTLLPLKEA